MRTIYIDPEFKCHVEDNGSLTAVETGFFDGKCDTYIEGYRFIPDGAVWIREDGNVFDGEMVCAWKDHRELELAQMAHDRQLLNEYAEALKVLGVTV